MTSGARESSGGPVMSGARKRARRSVEAKQQTAFRDVTGGAYLAFKGGMSSRLVLLPYMSAHTDTDVSVRPWDRTFRQMVFGSASPSERSLEILSCVEELQHLVHLALAAHAGSEAARRDGQGGRV